MNITRRLLLIPLWAGLAIVPLIGLPVAASPAPPQGGEQPPAKQKTVQMRIVGMTCAACAKGLEASFRHMAGVEKASIDYKTGQAVITFDPSKQNAEGLSKLVTSCGYQVKETKVV